MFIVEMKWASAALEEALSDLAAARRVIAHQQITCTEQLEELRRLRAAVLKCEEEHGDHASMAWAANLPRE